MYALSIQIEKFFENQESKVTSPSEQLYVTLLQGTFPPSFSTLCTMVLEKKSKMAKKHAKIPQKIEKNCRATC